MSLKVIAAMMLIGTPAVADVVKVNCITEALRIVWPYEFDLEWRIVTLPGGRRVNPSHFDETYIAWHEVNQYHLRTVVYKRRTGEMVIHDTFGINYENKSDFRAKPKVRTCSVAF